MSANGPEGGSQGVATIDHQEVHVNLDKKANTGGGQQVVTSQPTVTYNNNPDGGPPVVFQGPPDDKDKPKDFVMTSCAVLLFCNFIFGFLGYHFGVKANHAWQLGDEMTSRHHAKKALIFVICGVVCGVCTYVLAITLYLTLNKSNFV
ncbi:uncharacterized protein LOC117330393 [Pecten maximus]|uniref:uncharacterized protein LOC117330393 n=1 Tax=Pecten maximus TaxID=6579 RepID=UPI001459130F|nr:uncharacterized protein LOC117330393 [Pecten maximus]